MKVAAFLLVLGGAKTATCGLIRPWPRAASTPSPREIHEDRGDGWNATVTLNAEKTPTIVNRDFPSPFFYGPNRTRQFGYDPSCAGRDYIWNHDHFKMNPVESQPNRMYMRCRGTGYDPALHIPHMRDCLASWPHEAADPKAGTNRRTQIEDNWQCRKMNFRQFRENWASSNVCGCFNICFRCWEWAWDHKFERVECLLETFSHPPDFVTVQRRCTTMYQPLAYEMINGTARLVRYVQAEYDKDLGSKELDMPQPMHDMDADDATNGSYGQHAFFGPEYDRGVWSDHSNIHIWPARPDEYLHPRPSDPLPDKYLYPGLPETALAQRAASEPAGNTSWEVSTTFLVDQASSTILAEESASSTETTPRPDPAPSAITLSELEPARPESTATAAPEESDDEEIENEESDDDPPPVYRIHPPVFAGPLPALPPGFFTRHHRTGPDRPPDPIPHPNVTGPVFNLSGIEERMPVNYTHHYRPFAPREERPDWLQVTPIWPDQSVCQSQGYHPDIAAQPFLDKFWNASNASLTGDFPTINGGLFHGYIRLDKWRDIWGCVERCRYCIKWAGDAQRSTMICEIWRGRYWGCQLGWLPWEVSWQIKGSVMSVEY